MSTFIIAIHIIVCIALILIVLLQTGKGADMGAVFGGGSSQTLFGSSGASTFLTKMTTAAAVIFMLTSLSLAYFSGQRTTSSVMPASTPAGEQAPGEMKDSGAVESSGQEAPDSSATTNAVGGNGASGDTQATDSASPVENAPAPGADSAGTAGEPGQTG